VCLESRSTNVLEYSNPTQPNPTQPKNTSVLGSTWSNCTCAPGSRVPTPPIPPSPKPPQSPQPIPLQSPQPPPSNHTNSTSFAHLSSSQRSVPHAGSCHQ
jgi:hypothetical protein